MAPGPKLALIPLDEPGRRQKESAIDDLKRSVKPPSSRLLMPGITTAANANRNPATREQRNAANSRAA